MEIQDNICNTSLIRSECILKEKIKKNNPETKSDKEYLSALSNCNVLKIIEWNVLAFIIFGALLFIIFISPNI